MARKSVPLAWAGVTLVGVIVVILVVSWQLFTRLGAAQSMVDDLNPAFTVDRVIGARGGLEMVSAATDTADAMMHSGGAAAEVPKFIDFIAARTGSTHDDAEQLLRNDFPAINGFLTSLPLPEVSAELPKLVHYLGTVLQTGKVSDLAYHNSLMVHVWSSLAARDARLVTAALRRFPAKPVTTSWATYVRCHDDIGWAVDDADAAAVGWDGPAHRAFLSDWYSGAFPGSDARGLVFQENGTTGDRRISGTAASLAGLEKALEDDDALAVELATRRLLLAHLVVLGFGGLPLLWMGDELALRNDPHWDAEPPHAADNRWAHRPQMPWDVAERRHVEGTLEHRVWQALRHAVEVRGAMPAMHASIESALLDPVNPAVLAFVRHAPTQTVVALHNLSEREQRWPWWAVPLGGPARDLLTGAIPRSDGQEVVLPPYGVHWLVSRSPAPP